MRSPGPSPIIGKLEKLTIRYLAAFLALGSLIFYTLWIVKIILCAPLNILNLITLKVNVI